MRSGRNKATSSSHTTFPPTPPPNRPRSNNQRLPF